MRNPCPWESPDYKSAFQNHGSAALQGCSSLAGLKACATETPQPIRRETDRARMASNGTLSGGGLMIAIVALIVALAVGQSSPTAESVGRLSGRVVLDGTNTPISSARVTLLPAARPTGPFGPPPQTTTDQDGRFLFDRVVPGEYHVQVQKTGYATLFELSSDRSVRIAAGGAVEGALRLQKGAAISGRVIDALGEPVADARVIAIRRFGQRGGGSTGFVSAGGGGGQQTNDLGEFRVS